MYLAFMTIHVIAAIAWLGAALAFQVMNVRVARADDGAAVGFMAEQGAWFGQRYFSIAGITTLLSGIVMVVVSDSLSFGDLWITFGLVGIAISIFIGSTLIRRTTDALDEAVTAGDTGAVASLQSRLNLLGSIDLVVVFLVVVAMVYKPG